MHRHEMQQSNIYLGIYIIEYYFFWKNQGVTMNLQEKRRGKLIFCLNSLKNERVRRVVRYIAIYTMNESRSDGSKIHAWDMHGVLDASAFSHTRNVQRPTYH
jgi:hypothetical protein